MQVVDVMLSRLNVILARNAEVAIYLCKFIQILQFFLNTVRFTHVIEMEQMFIYFP